MSNSAAASTRRRWRAPAEDGAKLIDPPLDSVEALLIANVELAAGRAGDLAGKSIRDLAELARRELLTAAERYTARYRDVERARNSGRIVLAGHQPGLFHPGVWLKNFVLDRVGAEHDATAVNLLVDSDTVRGAALRVPGGTVDEPRAAEIAYDRATAEIPYEEREIVDRELLASFAERATEQIAPLVPDPFVAEFWPRVIEAARSESRLGACFAQARHSLEGDLGLATLELPQSEVCEFESFHWFAAHLFGEAARFREVYNRALWEYRRANRIRSTSHPVPELAADGQWIEAPFWIWQSDAPRRRRVFVRRTRDVLTLTDRAELEIELPWPASGEAGRAVEVLSSLAARGIKLRGRALLTTLFARLLLGDLFLHGIGGAKYDELTDRIVERFYGCEPPAFLVVSGTLRLPIERPRVSADDLRAVDHTLRELVYHPERQLVLPHTSDEQTGAATAETCTKCLQSSGHLPPEIASLVVEKQTWIDREPTPETAGERHRAIRFVNESLQSAVSARCETLLLEREKLASALRAEAVLGWREYAFCLYPAETLWNFLLEFQGGRT